MNWKAKVAAFAKQVGPACKFAAKTVLGTMIPGSPAVIELVERALDCAASTADQVWDVEKDSAAARDLERIGNLLETMQTQLGAGLKQIAGLEGDPAKARRILDVSLASNAELRRLGEQLQIMAAGFDRLEMQMDRVAGRQQMSLDMQHENRVLQRLNLGMMLLMYSEKGNNPELREQFRSALAALGEGQVETAYPILTALVKQLPESSAVQGALGVVQAVENDLPGAQVSLARATHLNPTNPALQKLSERVTKALTRQTPLIPNPDAPLRVGQIMGGWEVVQLLGIGGSGQVVKGRKGEQIAALKVLHPRLSRDEAILADFRKEMMALMRLGRQRHLAEILDFGFCQQQWRWFFVMGLVQGMSLQTYLDRHGLLTLEEAVTSFRPVAEALGRAHALEIVHRDVKPANLLRADDGSLTLVDFGLAGATTARGTLGFASPEQLRGQPGDARSDVYSLAATLYHAMTRHAPEEFERESIAHSGLADLLAQSLAINPKKRQANAAEFAACLHLEPRTLPVPNVNATPQTVLPTPRPAETVKVLTNSIGMNLAYIPPGTFSMGSPEGEEKRNYDEQEHDVEITKGFYLGVYQVTQGEYAKVMGKNPSYFSAKGDGKAEVKGLDTSRFPVEQVSYKDAVKFCAKLSEMAVEKQKQRVYRLPTEAEWEYACRGGAASKTPFHYGESLSSDLANCDCNDPYGGTDDGTYLERTCKVGSYDPNGFGLYDMHGNVWELCSDWYAADYYGKSPKHDPQGPSKGSDRLIRGGCWNDLCQSCRSAYRRLNGPTDRSSDVGFRVVLVTSGQE